MPGKRTAVEDLPFWAQGCNFGMVFNTVTSGQVIDNDKIEIFISSFNGLFE